ncbi:preprotein translocase subunit SecY [Candidatus Peregrinibacteria bacterium CG10_big_fil_rev_8_21_14_0_10_49_16]|nr:MAG: preprotein translocase subunit SecY [Candidatus Peregrinibacteria bacterium CG22_combo_CG10-13_8_21_14_all_49_11]PIR51843.1 MAG: preprotein translocase subunit SecY [Candidatus Peregrinibacteria bacterium CG10_big_fil_rev_8_21_14_0_10_49_16]
MFTYLRQLWHTEDLRKRILFACGILLCYRIAAHITIPGADPYALQGFLAAREGGGVLGVFAALTGGAIDNFSVMLLGLAPYINASIIMQLCTVIFPKLESLAKEEGVQGQQQINKYTRWLSFPLAFIQSYGFLLLLNRGGVDLVPVTFPDVLAPMLFVTTGSLILMWFGELITEKGIGNGISLIIFVGIVSEIPARMSAILFAGDGKMGAFFLFAALSLALLVAVVLFTDAHRLLPITYANQGAGRGVQGNIPIRLNQAGMIPIIFAISLITLPAIIAQLLATAPRFQDLVSFINIYMNASSPSLVYIMLYFLLVLGFTYFYVSVTFQPEKVAETIQKRGGFIPGVRPGKQTAEILAKTSNRLNLWGGTFLGLIAIIPLIFTKYSTLSAQDLIITGSGMIIVVGVVMELIRQINAKMLAHDYDKLV